MNLAIILSYSWLGCLLVFTSVLVFFKRKYVTIYNKRPNLIFIVGLVLSRSISYTSVISVLMWYFTYYEGDLVMSAVLSNIHESLSSLFVIFMAHAADSFIGRFRTLLFSTSAYIGGLLLLWMFNPYDITWLLVVILILLALGTSGDNVLYDVLIDFVDDGDKSLDWSEKQSLLHAAVIWRVVNVIGAISATLWVVHDSIGGTYASWRASFMTCIIAITAGLIIFCKGHNLYRQGPLTKRPVEIFFRVFLASIQKLFNSNRRYTTNTSRQDGSTRNLDAERGENEQIRSPSNLDIKGQEEGGRGSSYTQKDMAVVKSLLSMFPMWIMFFAVSLVSATGSTFFLEQYSNLNTDNKIPIQIYNMIQSLSAFAIPFLYRWICGSRKNEKVKIGIGMLCGIICCVFAWQLEVHRLKEVRNLVNDQYENTSISFLWLVPQFCVLGCMEGLTGDGLLKFYKLKIIKEPISRYGEEYIEVVQCLGKLFNICLILILKRQLGWFSYTINDSRLDKYYILLVCVSSVNLVLYFCTVMCYYNDSEPPQESSDDDGLQLSDWAEPLSEWAEP